VQSIAELPVQVFDSQHGFLPRRLDGTGIPETNPECALRLLLLILKSRAVGPVWDIDAVKSVIQRCQQRGASIALAGEVTEELVRLGHIEAAGNDIESGRSE
ncbi:MAG: hypothetical protein C0418_05695, partial [Coriobacteriaceae bacterium]|nr:hypothetical protein [Coriobacteriaceae bacterium]